MPIDQNGNWFPGWEQKQMENLQEVAAKQMANAMNGLPINEVPRDAEADEIFNERGEFRVKPNFDDLRDDVHLGGGLVKNVEIKPEGLRWENVHEGAFERREEDGAIVWKEKKKIEMIHMDEAGIDRRLEDEIPDDPNPFEMGLKFDGPHEVVANQKLPREKRMSIYINYANRNLVMSNQRGVFHIEDLTLISFAQAVANGLNALFPNEFDIEVIQ